MPTLQDLQAQDDAFLKQASSDRQSQAAQEALKPKGQEGQEGGFASFISPFMMSPDAKVTTDMLNQSVQLGDTILNSQPVRKARDLGAGAITGATNIADSVVSLGRSLQEGGKANAAAEDPQDADAINAMPAPTSPIWDHAKASIMDFRDAVAVKDPTMADQLVQGAGQLAIPFAGFSRGLALLHGTAEAVGIGAKVGRFAADTLGAGAATDMTAVGPHDPRMADLFALGRHTEGKLGDTLRAIAPDGSAINGYINFLTDRSHETEAEGRWKNVLDGLGVNAIATPLIHAVGTTLKYGMAGLRMVIDNGVGSPGQLGPTPRSLQGGQIGWHGTTADFDAFDNSRINSGQGAQTQGYGHYIAENPATGGTYQKMLAARWATGSPRYQAAQGALDKAGGDPLKAYQQLTADAANEKNAGKRSVLNSAAQFVKSGNAGAGRGQLIKVDIKDEHIANMLDYDKPLSEQSSVFNKIPKDDQKQMQSFLTAHGQDLDLSELTGGEFRQLVEKMHGESWLVGGDPEDTHLPRLASQYLSANGIPGTKYWDAGSRTEGQGTRNFVVHDGKHIKVLEKVK